VSAERNLLVDDEKLDNRRKAWASMTMPLESRRGYDRLYASEVSQADEGCDFSFLLPIEKE